MRESFIAQLVSIKLAAEIADMSPQLLWHYVKTGRGPINYKIGGYTMYHPEEVKEWVLDKPQPDNRGGWNRKVRFQAQPRSEAEY